MLAHFLLGNSLFPITNSLPRSRQSAELTFFPFPSSSSPSLSGKGRREEVWFSSRSIQPSLSASSSRLWCCWPPGSSYLEEDNLFFFSSSFPPFGCLLYSSVNGQLRTVAKNKPLSRPALPQLLSFQIRHMTILNYYIKFDNLLIFSLWNCERVGRDRSSMVCQHCHITDGGKAATQYSWSIFAGRECVAIDWLLSEISSRTVLIIPLK